MDHTPVVVLVTVIDGGITQKQVQMRCGCTNDLRYDWGHNIVTPG